VEEAYGLGRDGVALLLAVIVMYAVLFSTGREGGRGHMRFLLTDIPCNFLPNLFISSIPGLFAECLR
jgi:hypothetical protein